MDTIPIPELQSSEIEEVIENLVEAFQEITIKPAAKGWTDITKTAEQYSIPCSRAYKLLDDFNAGDGSVLPGNISKALERGPKNCFHNIRPY
ncbi:hypothetical protein BY458DRAFT_552804 [Sporodiniella umbellata]|nr:hypothetical protein BY458DRAFT_552804 [Sporodiniella umbellata]